MVHDGPGCKASVEYMDVLRVKGVVLSRMKGIDAKRLLSPCRV
jgi:hypothetical protein